MSKGLEALHKIEKEILRLYGMDIAYDGKIYDLFHIVGKELQALAIIISTGIVKPYESIFGQCWLEAFYGTLKLNKEDYELLKEVML